MPPFSSTRGSGTPTEAGGEWRVSLHRGVRGIIEGYGIENRHFKPTLAQVLAALKRDPKRFPKKTGPLQAARAVQLRFRGAAWRAVFMLDEDLRLVTVLSLGPHDRAYAEAERRLG